MPEPSSSEKFLPAGFCRPPHLAQTKHSREGLLSPESPLLSSSRESFAASSGGGGNGGGGGVIRTGTWGWANLVGGDSGECGLGLSQLCQASKDGLLEHVQLRGQGEKCVRGSPETLPLMGLPAHPCQVAGFSNRLYHPPISETSSGSASSSLPPGLDAGLAVLTSLSPTQMGSCMHACTHAHTHAHISLQLSFTPPETHLALYLTWA